MAIRRRVKAVIQFRRGEESEWIALNPILRLGEPAYSIDIGKLKIGNGILRWTELPYIGGGGGGGDVDDRLSPISVNPVQNKVITKALQEMQAEISDMETVVVFGTTSYWDSQSQLISKENTLYVYTDGFTKDFKNIARMKVGDGVTRLIDLPFIDVVYYDHTEDPTIHITQKERDFWNNKVSCYTEGENLVFTTENI